MALIFVALMPSAGMAQATQVRRQPDDLGSAGPQAGSNGRRRSRAAKLPFPLAGHVRVRGLTAVAVENILKNKLKNNYKDENLDVTVAVANAPKDIPEDDLKPKVFITGEVTRPGSYVVRQPTTLMQAIALAGGLGPYAAKNRIQVRRRAPTGDETIFMFNYKAYQAGA